MIHDCNEGFEWVIFLELLELLFLGFKLDSMVFFYKRIQSLAWLLNGTCSTTGVWHHV